ncbi:hypothetical protein D5H75_38820 [Bailinhaonella thermotolerans]|uniref:DUF676 domain-containing protein n=1 Tax=Bailinhaonella thermotolerans TaxID=1070861 RepID=A0A3A4ANK6_9ACTN|nr:hypothetical protein D5H75_38820 [Bailinhaonella thermotolerans]
MHGLDTGANTDCRASHGEMRELLREYGWSGPIQTVAYYKGDRRCDLAVPGRSKFDANTSIATLGKALANLVYDKHSRHGRAVDLVGTSMGGLIVRAALTGVQRKEKGFPPYLYVEDAVTLGTPHNGGYSGSCHDKLQCHQMRKADGGKLARWLSTRPQSPGFRTDWTVIGSEADQTVPGSYAVALPAPHKILYHESGGIGHNGLWQRWFGTFPATIWNSAQGSAPRYTDEARQPVHAVSYALKYQSAW